jgi:transcriptional regulator with GAF, ATPase, and Fis domain
LLRVLQGKEIERVGGTKTIPVDIRVIAATNRDLEQMILAGTFRKDLWFRLNVFPVHIPPLRERREDITALVVHFIERKAKEMRLGSIPTLAPGAVDTLMAYPWPGNVRELENVVERALILNPEGPLGFDSLIDVKPKATANMVVAQESADLGLDSVIAGHIERVLDLTAGRVHGKGGAAEKLGLNPSTLRSRMKKLGIKHGRRVD